MMAELHEPVSVLDLYCGCGAFSCGFLFPELDHFYNIKYAVDIDPNVRNTFEKNFPDTEFFLSDIKDLDPRNFLDVDIVIGSPPCQLFSIGNNSNNKRDPDAGMILVNVFRKWIKVIKPRYWIMENVKEIYDYLSPSLYPTKHILDASKYGVPQKRFRCFSGEYLMPPVTHARYKTINLFGGVLHKWVTLREAINDLIDIPTDYVVSDQVGKKPRANSPYFSVDLPSRTVTTFGLTLLHKSMMYDKKKKTFKGKDAVEGNEYKRLTPRQLARLQSFPDSFELVGERESVNYMMVGNAVPPLLASRLAIEIKKDITSIQN